MSNTSKRYTLQDDEAIFKAVQDSPHNLSKCFVALANELGRSPDSIAYRWYKVLSNPNHEKYMGTATVLMSKKRVTRNRKISVSSEPVSASIWNKLLNLLRRKR